MSQPNANECILWGTAAETGRTDNFVWQFDSPRAGGSYLIDLLAQHRLPLNDTQIRAKLTTWIVDQHRSGEQWPLITTAVIEQSMNGPMLRLSERVERLFLYLSSIRFKPGSTFSVDQSSEATIWTISAWTESENEGDLYGLLNMLEASGLLESVGSWRYTLTPRGFERLEAAELTSTNSIQCFVAMWFGAELDKVYNDGFSAGISDAGYHPFRIDQKEHANKIDDEIISEIRRSRFVVADFTCPIIDHAGGSVANARGGVYYEAGFAQGLQLPVIWTVREDCLTHVHFDTRQFAHIVWKTSEDLRVSLRNRIGSVIGLAPGH